MEQEKELSAVKKTQIYLENYREMVRYVEEAVSEASQVPDAKKYNISAEKAFLQSIRECRAETVILLEHISRALEALKKETEETGERYKYDALEAVYVKGKSFAYVAQKSGCGKNTPKKWCRAMTERLSIKLFGAKALESSANFMKNRNNLNKTG